MGIPNCFPYISGHRDCYSDMIESFIPSLAKIFHYNFYFPLKKYYCICCISNIINFSLTDNENILTRNIVYIADEYRKN